MNNSKSPTQSHGTQQYGLFEKKQSVHCDYQDILTQMDVCFLSIVKMLMRQESSPGHFLDVFGVCVGNNRNRQPPTFTPRDPSLTRCLNILSFLSWRGFLSGASLRQKSCRIDPHVSPFHLNSRHTCQQMLFIQL